MRRINHEVMDSTILPENKSIEQNRADMEAVQALCDAAIALDSFNPGEGLLGMATLAVRHGIMLKDARNRLAYDMALLKREIKGLRRELAELRKAPTDEKV
jgi:hypothetical protein